jgi:hypothetical protein
MSHAKISRITGRAEWVGLIIAAASILGVLVR